MGKKLREKTKKDKRKKKPKNTNSLPKKPKIKPQNVTNKVLKEGSVNDLQNELQKLSELNRLAPSKNTKNKEKRRELVMLRKGMKKKILSKLRRKHQQREEMLNENEGEKYTPRKTMTIENMREKDETFIDTNDKDLQAIIENDEYKPYFNNEIPPAVVITTSIDHHDCLYKFIRELKNIIPNSEFYYRKKLTIAQVIKESIEHNYTDIIIVTERSQEPYKLILIHLPSGPTLEFKLMDIIYQDEIPGHGTSAGHNPELLFKNFNTTLGQRVKRALNALFPRNEELKGRELVTFHNQRDYIFFRYYRYIFTDEYSKVNLQELGPRFVMRLQYVQKGLYDPDEGEFEWVYSDKMGVKRRKFYL